MFKVGLAKFLYCNVTIFSLKGEVAQSCPTLCDPMDFSHANKTSFKSQWLNTVRPYFSFGHHPMQLEHLFCLPTSKKKLRNVGILYSPGVLHPWDFPGKDIGVGCHFLLQGIFPTEALNSGLQHCRLFSV